MKRVPQGFALITAAIVLLVAASVALMLTNEVSMGQRLLATDSERADLRYLIEAGFAHADWQLGRNDTCVNYSALPATNFGGHSYNASYSPDYGSPVSVTLTATHGGGVTQVASRNMVAAYQTPTQVVLQPSAADSVDAYIWQSNPDTKYGTGDETWVSCCGSNTSRSLLQFDLSTLVTGAKIVGATLSMHHRSGNDPNVPVTAHRLTSAWNDANVTWNNRDDGTPWNTGGGDYDPAVIATTSVGPASNVRYEWDVSDLVKAWYGGAVPNYGLVLATSKSGSNGERFDTSDYSDPTRRPSLTIELACECGVICATAGSDKLLMVVVDPLSLLTQEALKEALIESWGYTVTLIDEDDTQANFDAAVVANDVVFISEDIQASTVANKLVGALIGVVTEEDNLSDEFGLSTSIGWESGTQIEVNNNTHFITEPFALGLLTVFSVTESLAYATGTLAPDLGGLASSTSGFGLLTLDAGATMHAGGSAAGRRVMLPWGGTNMDVGSLTTNGLTIFERALEWGAEEGDMLVGHWKLDDATGSTATDSSGRGNDGTLNGSPAWTTGYLDGALAFDDISSDRVVIPDDPSLDLSSAITLAAWIKPNDMASQFIIQKMVLNGTDGYELSLASTGKVFFRLNQQSDGNLYRVVSTSSYLADGSTWMHIAGTFDGATARIYVNGLEEGSKPAATSIATNNIGLSLGGQVDGTRVLDGVIDDARVYGNALSAAAIAELAAPAAGTLPIAHWKLDDGGGFTAIDSEGGHDGTLVNPPAWVSGQVAGGLDFDGMDDYVDLGSNAELVDVFDGGATVAAWIYPRGWGENANGRILDKASQVSGNREGWMIGVVGSTPALQFAQGFTGTRGYWRSQSGTVDLNTWVHFAVVYDASSVTNDAEIYLDGVKQSSLVEITPTGTIATDAGISMRMGNYAQATSRTFDGIIDDVRIYDRMLTAAEVASIATTGGGGGGGPSCDGTFRDEFNAVSFANNDGTLTWDGDWLEVGESDGPTSNDVRVRDDNGPYQLWIRDNQNGGEGVERQANLSGASSATLSFIYRRSLLDDANDYVKLEVSSNGDAGPWTELGRIEGPGTDSAYLSFSQSIDAHISPNTRIRLISSPTMGNLDLVIFDNIEISCSP